MDAAVLNLAVPDRPRRPLSDDQLPSRCRFQALLRLVGLTFLIAFSSYWVQLPGLYGEDGIEPASAFLLRQERWMGAR